MMNKIIIVSLICVLVLCGCGANTNNVEISKEEYENLIKKAAETQSPTPSPTIRSQSFTDDGTAS